jgi:NAD(P)-dependent dehydrogenase (short-subunit alcohol dehydrogenase family)
VTVKSVLLDLTSLHSVRKAAEEINSSVKRIDILINNAGVMAIPDRTLTEDGYEMQFATNHLGHFLFTNLIMDKVEAAATTSLPGETRIINVSSKGYEFSPFRFSDWNFEGKPITPEERPDPTGSSPVKIDDTARYDTSIAYGQSKTANILFSVSINAHLGKHGVSSFAVHPGSK